ncbi:hypothetical protein L228DRAFT_21520 [Xylona heveae TC161]|uniref:Ubiquitin-like domain-containing protein n=1 Tax=Xylona heveae (strain CBS 132557 / TC161) TaxID=1328760 RepID=A0A165K2E9_XYLHT|nr:hypothetical protein L228DRAFT_21520 [Xylona heveae TC161]KZF26906.1 hypothetical protein L228DRAFT_21520 [Xylona heveae TC161]
MPYVRSVVNAPKTALTISTVTSGTPKTNTDLGGYRLNIRFESGGLGSDHSSFSDAEDSTGTGVRVSSPTSTASHDYPDSEGWEDLYPSDSASRSRIPVERQVVEAPRPAPAVHHVKRPSPPKRESQHHEHTLRGHRHSRPTEPEIVESPEDFPGYARGAQPPPPNWGHPHPPPGFAPGPAASPFAPNGTNQLIPFSQPGAFGYPNPFAPTPGPGSPGYFPPASNQPAPPPPMANPLSPRGAAHYGGSPSPYGGQELMQYSPFFSYGSPPPGYPMQHGVPPMYYPYQMIPHPSHSHSPAKDGSPAPPDPKDDEKYSRLEKLIIDQQTAVAAREELRLKAEKEKEERKIADRKEREAREAAEKERKEQREIAEQERREAREAAERKEAREAADRAAAQKKEIEEAIAKAERDKKLIEEAVAKATAEATAAAQKKVLDQAAADKAAADAVAAAKAAQAKLEADHAAAVQAAMEKATAEGAALLKAAEEKAKADQEAAVKAAAEKAAADAKKAAEDAAAAAAPPPDMQKKPIRFKDAVGRKFSFPFHLCKTWQGMEELIKQAFLHVEFLGPHVAEGHYDLVGPNGEIILPPIWETVIEPDWAITMHMWPMPEPPAPAPAPEVAAAPPPPPAAPARGTKGAKGGTKKTTPAPHPEVVIVPDSGGAGPEVVVVDSADAAGAPPVRKAHTTKVSPLLMWAAGRSAKSGKGSKKPEPIGAQHDVFCRVM